jgi:hypothetical protein
MKKFEQKIIEYEMNNRAKLIMIQEKIRSYKQETDKQNKMDHASLPKVKELYKELDKLVDAYNIEEQTVNSLRFIDDIYDFNNFDGKLSILHEKSKIDAYMYMFNLYYRGIYKVSKKYYECLRILNVDNIDVFNSRFKTEILIGLYNDKSISQILESPFFLRTNKKYFK